MDCKEFKELIPGFALGTLEGPEQTSCLAHLADATAPHPGCREALAEAQAVAAQLAAVLPDRSPSPRVWQAIEAAVAQPVVGRTRRGRRPTWRELSGWFVAAAVTGLYLYNTPIKSTRVADAALESPAAVKRAVNLMMASETRRYVFQPQQDRSARGSLILNASEKSAVVLVDRFVLEPGHGLRLWAVRDQATPALLAPLTATVEGIATAELGTALFEPTLPRELQISFDSLDAAAPRSVLLVAHLGD